MYNFVIPEEKKARVILNTDAKNEVDDQFAIVHTLLTQSFELHGIIPAHFGKDNSQQESYEETMLLLRMMNLEGKVRIENGAPHAMTDAQTPVGSPGARFIIEEAMKEDDRPLYIAFLGPLTDMASALLLEPKIAQRNIKVIWIGGGNWPEGGWEYNLRNDVHSANVVLQSSLELWQIPRDVYRMMPVTYSELTERVSPHGELGRYLTDNVIQFNNAGTERPTEYRILGDSPAIGVILYGDCGKWAWQPAPILDSDMQYIHTGKYRPIKVYETIDARFILEDFYAKLAQFHRLRTHDK